MSAFFKNRSLTLQIIENSSLTLKISVCDVSIVAPKWFQPFGTDAIVESISLCMYFLETGSTPAHKSYAIAIAYKPQSVPPSWHPTFTTLMVKLVYNAACLLYFTVSFWHNIKRVQELHIGKHSALGICVTICTNSSDSDILTPLSLSFNIYVSCSPFWEILVLTAEICVAVSHLPSTT